MKWLTRRPRKFVCEILAMSCKIVMLQFCQFVWCNVWLYLVGFGHNALLKYQASQSSATTYELLQIYIQCCKNFQPIITHPTWGGRVNKLTTSTLLTFTHYTTTIQYILNPCQLSVGEVCSCQCRPPYNEL